MSQTILASVLLFRIGAAQGFRVAKATASCNDGHFPSLDGTRCIPVGSCENGELVEPTEQMRTNQCGSCDDGFFLKRSYDDAVLGGPRCHPVGSCENGELVEPTEQMVTNHCGSCDDGFFLKRSYHTRHAHDYFSRVASATCIPVGSCENGKLANPTEQKWANQCGGCDNGYFLYTNYSSKETLCQPVGSCENGKLRDPNEQRRPNQCSSCDDGYFLSVYDCRPVGSCENGKSVDPTEQEFTNQCARGGCDYGYFFKDNRCHSVGSCENGKLRDPSGKLRIANECGSCNNGYFLEHGTWLRKPSRCVKNPKGAL